MTHEEKLAEAKRLYKTANADQRYVLECLFPELAESEDEKNIKDLIDELKCSLRAANCQNYACEGGHEKRIALLEWGIAWLKKQDTNKEYVFRPLAGTTIETAIEQALKQGNVVLAFNGFYTPVKGKTSDEILTEYDHWCEKQGKVKESLFSQHEIEMCKENDDSLTSERMLNADEVIDWIEGKVPIFWGSPCNPSKIVGLFKKDFEL